MSIFLISNSMELRQHMRHRGFTVIEILLVALVISLACLLGVVSISQHTGSMVLGSAGLSILQISRYGRLMAVENHRPYRLCIDLDNRQYWLADRRRSSSPKKDTTRRLESINTAQDSSAKGIVNIYLQKRQLPERVRFVKVSIVEKESVDRGLATIVFNADGTAQAGIIQIASDDQAQTIMIHPYTARAELNGGLIDTLPVEVIDLDNVKGKSDIYR